MSASLFPLPPATLVDGRYKVLRSLGAGRFGVVYEARDLDSDRAVALRVVHSHLVGNVREFGARFFAEGARRVRLMHQHTLRVFDFGRTGEDRFFMVMELVRGASLSRALSSRGPLAPALGAQICKRVCASLEEAHDHGIVHAQLSPSLVWLTGRGLEGIKVMGYGDPAVRGVAELAPWAARHARYAAPELLAGERPTPASDVYGLGLLLYELVAGQPAFTHDSAVRILLAQRQGEPMQGAYGSGLFRVSPSLAEIIGRCLRVNPSERFEHLGSLRRALEHQIVRAAA